MRGPHICLSHCRDKVQTFPTAAAYEDIVAVLERRYGDHQLTATYQSQLKTRIQLNGQSLHEITEAIEQ
jgi:hypothetical protein